MPCVKFGNSIICVVHYCRLRLQDGRYIYMEYHNYLGPQFYLDRNASRSVDDWWDDPYIVEALEWFESRGKKA